MSILCKLFGHKYADLFTRQPYFRISSMREDACDRYHASLTLQCERCHRSKSVGSVHMPREFNDFKSRNIEYLFRQIVAWQDAQFPKSKLKSKIQHLKQEVLELEENPTDKEEIADCFILLAGIANKAGYDLYKDTQAKFTINRSRKWGKPDEDGVYSHIENEKPN